LLLFFPKVDYKDLLRKTLLLSKFSNRQVSKDDYFLELESLYVELIKLNKELNKETPDV